MKTAARYIYRYIGRKIYRPIANFSTWNVTFFFFFCLPKGGYRGEIQVVWTAFTTKYDVQTGPNPSRPFFPVPFFALLAIYPLLITRFALVMRQYDKLRYMGMHPPQSSNAVFQKLYRPLFNCFYLHDLKKTPKNGGSGVNINALSYIFENGFYNAFSVKFLWRLWQKQKTRYM